jgi:cytochrome P450
MPNPTSTYRRLLEVGPVSFDEALGSWVVTGYREIQAALTDPALRTRPLAEPVPAALVGHPTGAMFGRLVRMTDDPASREVRRALELAIASVPGDEIDRRDWPTRCLHRIPITVVATLLGLTGPALDDITGHVVALVRAIAPPPFAGPVADGDHAVTTLTTRIAALLDDPASDRTGLLATFARQPVMATPAGRDLVIANAIGLLIQSLDATAGLIGNSLRALAARPMIRADVVADSGRLDRVLRETLRLDAPVQNTRRFVARETRIGQRRLAPGDRMLLVVAAGNRDPTIFSDPERFDLDREGPEPLTFGIGPHRCPGQRLAWAIAHAGVRHAVWQGLADERYRPPEPRYLPSGNARVPLILDPGSGPSREQGITSDHDIAPSGHDRSTR